MARRHPQSTACDCLARWTSCRFHRRASCWQFENRCSANRRVELQGPTETLGKYPGKEETQTETPSRILGRIERFASTALGFGRQAGTIIGNRDPERIWHGRDVDDDGRL